MWTSRAIWPKALRWNKVVQVMAMHGDTRLKPNLAIAKLEAAGAEVLSRNPALALLNGFMSAEECAHFIGVGKGIMQRAKVVGTHGNVKDRVRTNSYGWVKHHYDPIFSTIGKRMEQLVGIPLNHAEDFQIIEYQPGQEYKAHLDGFDPTTPNGKKQWIRGGQRIVTALCYLNTVPEGGATAFPQLNLTVPAVAGTLCVFQNTLPGTNYRHPKSLHAGTPVISGEKWAFNLWFREADRRTNPPLPPSSPSFRGRRPTVGTMILNQTRR